MSKLLCFMVSLVFAAPAWVSEVPQWQEKINRQGITVYQQKRSPEYKQHHTKGHMQVKAKPAAVFALLQDLTVCEQWLYGCQTAERLPNGMVSMVFDGPLWFKDRDVVFASTSQFNATQKSWTIEVTNQPQQGPATKAVRVQHATAQWTLLPKPDQQLVITYELYMDPEISMRSGVNKYNRDAMYLTLKQMREMLQKSPYKEASDLPDTD